MVEDTQVDHKPSARSATVALITLARYLSERDRHLGGYLRESLHHAQQMKVPDADLADLRLIVGALPRS